jgi:hypothetical protein
MGKVIIGGNSFKLNTENMVDNLYRDHHLGKSKGSTHKKHVPGIHLHKHLQFIQNNIYKIKRKVRIT